MVTHNEELAKTYSTRVIKLLDGEVLEDSNPYHSNLEETEKMQTKKIAMSFKTALSLSFNNLLTKKGRTILTSFAGSIGIIGIALILSLSSGMNNYISKVESDALSSYPISVQETTFNATEFINSLMVSNNENTNKDDDKIYSNDIFVNMLTTMSKGIQTNNLESFKEYIDSNQELADLTLDIQYNYDVELNIYKENAEEIIKVNPSDILTNMMANSNVMMNYEIFFKYD